MFHIANAIDSLTVINMNHVFQTIHIIRNILRFVRKDIPSALCTANTDIHIRDVIDLHKQIHFRVFEQIGKHEHIINSFQQFFGE